MNTLGVAGAESAATTIHSGLPSAAYVNHVRKIVFPWCARLTPHQRSLASRFHHRSW